MRIGCVILGGGAGTRFGEPKAGALLKSGHSFVDQVAQTALAAGVDELVAVLHPDVPPPAGVRAVVNANPASEQIASVRLGLAQLVNTESRGALLWPVDHPLVLEATIRALLLLVRERNPVIARATHMNQHGHPVYFSRDIWRELVTLNKGGAREIVHKYASVAVEIDVPDGGVLLNVDRREDLE
jgi:molybdenum cofactor cytidylyltransferase